MLPMITQGSKPPPVGSVRIVFLPNNIASFYPCQCNGHSQKGKVFQNEYFVMTAYVQPGILSPLSDLFDDSPHGLPEYQCMTVESMSQIVENIQSVYTIILALAVAEAFSQAIKETKPRAERPATTLASWFDCIHHSRFVSLIVFLLLVIPFFQGNQRYLYLQYIEPLHGLNPPRVVKALWLNFDCTVFSLEAGLFFVMSRSLSAHRWQQFYAAIIILLSLDFIWALIEKYHGAAVPPEWLWYDLIMAIVFAAIIVLDWFFITYDRNKDLNRYCYWAASILAVLSLAYGYFYEIDYLID
jgi:hypothetical protein